MHSQNLTSGNIGRQLVSLAIPLLLGNVLQQLYNTADSLIIGKYLGSDAFAAVGIAGTVMNLFVFVLSGFCVGVSILFGQFFGSGALDRFRHEMSVSLLWGSAFTLTLSAVFLGATHFILRAIQTPAALEGYVTAYLNVITCGLICTYLYNLCSGILRSVGDTGAALCFLLLAVCMNVALDLLFIAKLHTSAAGAAFATVFSQGFSAACCFVYLHRRYPELVCRKEDIGVHRELLGKTFSFGFASALQQSSLYIGKILVQGAVNTLDTPGIAALPAATRLEGFLSALGESGSASISVFASQNYGAGQFKRLAQGFRRGLCTLLLLGLGLSCIMIVFAEPGIRIFLSGDDPLELSYGISYLRLIALFYTLC